MLQQDHSNQVKQSLSDHQGLLINIKLLRSVKIDQELHYWLELSTPITAVD